MLSLRLRLALLLALAACAHAPPAAGVERTIRVYLAMPLDDAVARIEGAARRAGFGARSLGAVWPRAIDVGPYRLRGHEAIEVKLRAYALPAGGGSGTTVVVTGTERVVEARGAAGAPSPIARPAAGARSPTWDELERFAATIAAGS